MKIKKQRKKTRLSAITMHRIIALNAAYDYMFAKTLKLYEKMLKTIPNNERKNIKVIDLFNFNKRK